MKIGSDPRRSQSTPAASRKPVPTRHSSQPEDYDQLMSEAVRAARVDHEALTRRRQEQRRRTNILWLAGLLLALAVLAAVSWALLARRAQTPTSEGSVPVVVAPTGNAVSTPDATIPVVIRLITKAGTGATTAVLSTPNNEYKVVGKGELSEPEFAAAEQLSVPATLSAGAALEVCPGENCGDERLPDEHAGEQDMTVNVVADAPYALCARDAAGFAQRLAQFRVKVKVNK